MTAVVGVIGRTLVVAAAASTAATANSGMLPIRSVVVFRFVAGVALSSERSMRESSAAEALLLTTDRSNSS
jgi:hypothetical protein